MATTKKKKKSSKKANKIAPPKGKLGVLLPGMSGAVSTTFIAGVEAIKAGLGKPIGSLTQMGTIRIGKRTDKNSPLIKNFIPLCEVDDLVFAGWDIFADDCYEASLKSGVLDKPLLDDLKDNENNGFQNILMRACKKMKPFNNAIIQVSDDVYGEFLEKNRENVYKDCTVIVNGKFKIESCSIMLRAKSKFFDFLMSSKFKNAEIKN